MGWLIGTDEAGYGPNLGPLVVACTVWEVPDELLEADLYQLCAAAISAAGPKRPNIPLADAPPEAAAAGAAAGAGAAAAQVATELEPQAAIDSRRVVVADSKQLYQAQGSWRPLELPVLVAMQQLSLRPSSWHQLFRDLAPDDFQPWSTEPWNLAVELPFPRDAHWAEADRLTKTLTATLGQHHVRLAGVRARVLGPSAVNHHLDQVGNKAHLLSSVTLGLVRWAYDQCGGDQHCSGCRIWCDKHGGRNRYLELLQEHLTDQLLWVRWEGRRESRYRWGRNHEIAFSSGGERQLPAAWSSVFAKYLREQAMAAWNAYWQQHLPELKPSAGYPVDARRFLSQIQPLLEPLGLTPHQVWRNR